MVSVSGLPSWGPSGVGMLDPLNGMNPKNQGQTDRQTLARVAVEAETVFLTQLLETMRRSMVQGLASPQSRQMQGYQALADQHLARVLALGGGLGLARRIFADLAVNISENSKEVADADQPQQQKPDFGPDGNEPLPGAS
ncbi:MAG: hypothetical protein QME75_03140 [Deltaproteobacteria bacterium]|nr:hypothetical protein [Deltaproteobacteria bacterium]